MNAFMDKVAAMKHVLREQYPILSKTGSVYSSCDPSEILRQNKGKHALIMLASVQGAGKTTYCSKHFSSGCTVINSDNIARELLETNPNSNISVEELEETIYQILMQRMRDALNSGITVLDANAIDPVFRIHMLESFEELYDKVIIIALNPDRKTIKKQISGQISIRQRPGLWEEVEKELGAMELQLNCHIFEMGVDELYVV